MEYNYEAGVNDLKNLAVVNFLACKKIYEEVDVTHPFYDFLLLSANNSFGQAVSILYTLLCSTKKEELRIEPALKSKIKELQQNQLPNIEDQVISSLIERYKEDYPNNTDYFDCPFLLIDNGMQIGEVITGIQKIQTVRNGLNDLKNIKAKFISSHFNKIRHTSVAHKNQDLLSPSGDGFLRLQDIYIEELGKIIKDLDIYCHIWFRGGNQFQPALDSLSKILK